jgi:hypothetical protein
MKVVMTSSKSRLFTLTLGPFQATLFPEPKPVHGTVGYVIDLYHSGNEATHPRFLCTIEESRSIAKLAQAAESLASDFLTQGKTYEEWCKANDVNPFDPELP